jgi:hypothetical protein
MFAISTLWCSTLDVEEKVMSLWNSGIQHFELCEKDLSHLQSWSAKPWKICNLAMDAPTPEKLAETPSLAADNQQERQQAIARVLSMCAQAREHKIAYLVIWPGYIPLSLSSTVAPATLAVDAAARTCRARLAPAFVRRLCRSLFEITQKEPDITLCLPPARFACELLLHQELAWIFEDLPRQRLAYWHNTAVCHAQEKAGMASGEAWLSHYGRHIAGTHLEDWVDGQGLYPPGMGEVAFRPLLSYLPTHAMRVLHIAPRFGEAEMLECYQFLQTTNLL